jgi:crossover junction endodeoxyribonuclease RuvC
MQHMVRSALSLERTPGADAADALALAICHASAGRLAELGVRTRGGSRGAARRSWDVRRAR